MAAASQNMPISPRYVEHAEIPDDEIHTYKTSVTAIKSDPRNSRRTIKTKSNDFWAVKLPSGTLLFRAIHLNDFDEDDGRSFFADSLGIPFKTEDKTGYCLSSTQNIFTFPFPYIGFGLYDWTTKAPAWKKYNAFIVYVLTHTSPFVSMICPNLSDARGTSKRDDPYAIVRRCNMLGSPCFENKGKELLEKSLAYLKYDNCINPVFMKEDGIKGTIAISGDDSLGKRGNRTSDTPLGKYLELLKTSNSGTVDIINRNLYTDKDGLRGIPEIVSHVRHLSSTLTREATTLEDSISILKGDITSMVLNLLPIAVITSSGNIGISHLGINGAHNSKKTENRQNSSSRKLAIEKNLKEFMHSAETIGLGGSFGKVIQDSRTGFYVCETTSPPKYKEEFLINKRMSNFIFKRPGDGCGDVEHGAISYSTDKPKNSQRWRVGRGGNKTRCKKGGRIVTNIIIPKMSSITTRKNKRKTTIFPLQTIPTILPIDPEPISKSTLNGLSNIFNALRKIV